MDIYAVQTIIANDYLLNADDKAEVWRYAKNDLDTRMFENVIVPVLGDEQYHVFRSKYYRDFEPETCAWRYYMKLYHSIAQTQNFTIHEYSEVPVTAERICSACGNVLQLDKRGGCSACGHPAGEDWCGDIIGG